MEIIMLHKTIIFYDTQIQYSRRKNRRLDGNENRVAMSRRVKPASRETDTHIHSYSLHYNVLLVFILL